MRMITAGRAPAIILAMTPNRTTRHLLLVTDRRTPSDAAPAPIVRRYRLARLHPRRAGPQVRGVRSQPR